MPLAFFSRRGMQSLHDSMAVVGLQNDVLLGTLTGSQNTFHLGGAPGSGKTACVKRLIARLARCGLVSPASVLLCSKSNAATHNLRAHADGVPRDQFRTVNSAFAIPVINAATELSGVREDRLRSRIESSLGRLEMLVLDEYMTTGALEVVFVDAVLRLVKHRPEVPFGGVIVIFLGDNRQNSSVPTTADEVHCDSLARRVAAFLTELLERAFEPQWWSKSTKELVDAVLPELDRRKCEVASRVDDMLTSDPRAGPSPPSPGEDEEDCWSPELTRSVLLAMEAAERGGKACKTPVSDFVRRVRRVVRANAFFRHGREAGEEELDDLRNATIDVLVEECIRMEMDRLRAFAAGQNPARIASERRRVLEFASEAFGEITGTGREKSFVVSEIGEYSALQTPAATVVGEILHLKLAAGRCDEDECLTGLARAGALPGDEDEKYEWLGECVRNAMFRTGREIRGYEPLAAIFFSRLPELMGRLSDPEFAAEDMLAAAKVLAALRSEMAPDDDDNGDEDCADAPPGIAEADSIAARARACVRNQLRWNEWLDAADATAPQRCRFWHLYLLTRARRMGFLTDSNVLEAREGDSLFGSDARVPAGFARPYWLRALSMPSGVPGQLPAYSSMLSLTSATFVLSGPKRISVDSHAYGLMYALSLHDLTSPYCGEIDCRSVRSFVGPHDGRSEENNRARIVEYLGTIFPDMIRQFFALTAGEIQLNARLLQGRGAALVDSVARKLKCDRRSTLTAKALACFAAQAELELDGAGKTGGSLALTKSNASKDAVAVIAEMAWAAQSSRKRTRSDAALERMRSVLVSTTVSVGGCNVTPYLDKKNNKMVPETTKNEIADQIDQRRSKGHALVDRLTDSRLLAARHSRSAFTHELVRLRDRVTKVSSVVLAPQQCVVFTVTNAKPYIFGTSAPFYATEKGVVTDIRYDVDGELAVAVRRESNGERVVLRVGRARLGPRAFDGTVLAGAEVAHLPLASQQTLTIYSSQGWTFDRYTIVDPARGLPADAYVAVTRNSDVRLLRVLSIVASDLHVVENLKPLLSSRDRAHVYPLGGGLRGWGSESFRNYAAAAAADSAATANEESDGLVNLVQRNVLDLSGGKLIFNLEWTNSAAELVRGRSLAAELDRLGREFPERLVPGDARELLEEKLADLFMAAHRSVIHFRSAGGTSLLTPRISRSQLREILYDVFPHSLSALVFGAFAHFLLVDHGLVPLRHASFAFLPAAAANCNGRLRPTADPEGLEWESRGYARSKDGGRRESRICVTDVDRIVDSALREEEPDPEIVEKCLLHNRRRIGKYCRPAEVCGLERHGAVAVAVDEELESEQRNYQNVYAMLVVNLRMAAASTLRFLREGPAGSLPPGLVVSGCDPGRLQMACFLHSAEEFAGSEFEGSPTKLIVAHGGAGASNFAELRTKIANEEFGRIHIENVRGRDIRNRLRELGIVNFYVFLSCPLPPTHSPTK